MSQGALGGHRESVQRLRPGRGWPGGGHWRGGSGGGGNGRRRW